MDIQGDVRKAVWSRYWSHGVAHSCGGSYGNRYEGSLARFWRDTAGALAPGARILDIATGNGAVPRLLLDGAPGPIACDAIDLAEPDPQWLAGLPEQRRRQLRFHAQQAAEALPFPDACFDLVTSQYGLEYTDLARSLPEIRRVLRPGAKLRLLTHHADARPVRLAHTDLAHLAWMMAPDGLLELGHAMIARWRAPPPTPGAPRWPPTPPRMPCVRASMPCRAKPRAWPPPAIAPMCWAKPAPTWPAS